MKKRKEKFKNQLEVGAACDLLKLMPHNPSLGAVIKRDCFRYCCAFSDALYVFTISIL